MALEAKQQELQLMKRDLRRASVALGLEAPSILHSVARSSSVARSQRVQETPMPAALALRQSNMLDESIAMPTTAKARRRISFGGALLSSQIDALPVAPKNAIAASLYAGGPRGPSRQVGSDTENNPVCI